ncbi:MAG TPA: IS66 family transposase [Ktedonobacteraceae bacterium]|jgi:transposase
MSEEERIAHLEAENAVLRAEVQDLRKQLARVLAGQHERKHLLGKDSHNSSKPPSSDAPTRKTRSQRISSGRKPGGQPGHPGSSLSLVEQPDEIYQHRPERCTRCQHRLEGVVGEVLERRQVQDLPPWRQVIGEHQMEQVRCPECQQMNRGTFPVEVSAPAQYGVHVRALAVFLHQAHLVPAARTCEALAELCGCAISTGTIARWVQQAAIVLKPTVLQIAEGVLASPLQHGDETGVRVQGHLHWVHVNSTRWLTHLAGHRKRGHEALEAIGIWPRFTGRSMRDRWTSYDHYRCAHSICGAHLLRDLTFVEEQHQQWAGDLKEVLLGMYKAAREWRTRGATRLPFEVRDEWVGQYFEVLARGFAAQPPPEVLERRQGRRKQSAAKNLLDNWVRRAEQVLAFLEDLTISFTNNQAERDLRMVKVQQKISGIFRSERGLTAFCRIRSYLSTMRKQGRTMLAALVSVFRGHPFPIARGT